MTNHIVVYHDKCTDGSGSAWVTSKHIRENVEGAMVYLLPFLYNKDDKVCEEIINRINPKVQNHIYIVDFSIKLKQFAQLMHICRDLNLASVTVIDHHEGMEEDVKKYKDYFENVSVMFNSGPSISGATLCWEYFNPDKEMPTTLRHIADRDTWVFAMPGTKPFQKGIFDAAMRPENWDYVFDDANIAMHIAKGEILCEHEESIIEGITDKGNIRFINFGGTSRGIAINCPYRLTSDTCSRLLKTHGTVDFVISYNVTGRGYKFSLRSRNEKDFNCAKVAQMYGGNGHNCAAGFEVEFHSKELFEAKRDFHLHYL